MKKNIASILRLLSYYRETEPGFLLSGILAKVIAVLKPIILLYLAKTLLAGFIQKQALADILQTSFILLLIFLILSIIEEVAQARSDYHYKSFFKKHKMMKNMKLLDCSFEYAETNLADFTKLDGMERMRIFGILSFLEGLGQFVSSILAFVIFILLSYQAFLADAKLKLMSNFVFNLIFLALLLSLNLIKIKSLQSMMQNFGKLLQGKVMAEKMYLDTYNELIFDYKKGKDIRFYDRELADSFGSKYQAHQRSIYNHLFHLSNKTQAVSSFVRNFNHLIIYLYVGIKAISGSIVLENIVLFIGLMRIFVQAIEDFVLGFTTLKNSYPYREKLFALIDQSEKEKAKRKTSLKLEEAKDYQLSLDQVSFKYPGTSDYVLKDVDLEIPIGQKLAIVGKNGSGKTTLIKLLLGLYKPTKGKIWVNGQDLAQISFQDYRQIFSVLFQDFKIFSLELADNIAMLDNYDEEEIKQILDLVGLKKFYQKHGLQAFLYKDYDEAGIEVSGGEAQKIAMARAVYKAAKIFVFDEPTAALDPISESEIYLKFNEITINNTAIYISHRLSSCIFCDQIIVMDQGRIIQRGSHKELVQDEKSMYYSLWQAQAGYYQ